MNFVVNEILLEEASLPEIFIHFLLILTKI